MILIFLNIGMLNAQVKEADLDSFIIKNSTFVSNQNIEIVECSDMGVLKRKRPITLTKGLLFNIYRYDKDSNFVVIHVFKFTGSIFKCDKLIIDGLNEKYTLIPKTKINSELLLRDSITFISREELNNAISDSKLGLIKYFRIKKSDLARVSIKYADPFIRWEGVAASSLVTVKFRPKNDWLWEDNITLGLNIGAKCNFRNSNTSMCFLIGMNTSKATLNKYNTLNPDGTKMDTLSPTERIAFSPTVGIYLCYKQISFGVTGGIDFVNKYTSIEKGYIHNGKPWIGFTLGLGILNFKDVDKKPEPNIQEENINSSNT